MKIKKICVIFCLMFTMLILTGCENLVEFSNFYVQLQHNGSSTDGHDYVVTSNLDKLNIKIVNHEPQVLSYKVKMITMKQNSSVSSTDEIIACTNVENGTYNHTLPMLNSGYWYQVTVYGYTGESCSGEYDIEHVSMQTYVEESSNEEYISVKNITEKLGNWDYVNTSNGTEVSCSTYGIEDKSENIPLCIALAVKGSHDSYANDCAGFLKKVYKKVGIDLSPIYTAGKQIGKTYYSKPDTLPDELKDGDHIVMYKSNGDCSHIAMVFFWDAKGEWYTVNGNWGQSSGNPYVEVLSLDNMLSQTKWGNYHFRSI